MNTNLDNDSFPDDLSQEGQNKSAPADRVTNGPFDISEVTGIRPYIDFGSIKVLPREGLQLRLEVNDTNKQLVAITLEYQGSTMQVQAFSAPKTTGMWRQVRGEIADQLSSNNASSTVVTGVLGEELHAMASSDTTPEPQPVRFIAVDGPRWMLRGVLMGKAAQQNDAANDMISLFRDLVVVRGELPMPPGQLLPLQIPPGLTSTPDANNQQ